MNTIMTITWLTFQEARRRRVALAALGLGLVFIMLYAIGFSYVHSEASAKMTGSTLFLPQMHNFLVLAGLYVVHFLTIMLAIFGSVDTVSGEIATHTIQTIITKPVRRWQVLLGKWLGYALMLCGYLALLSGGILLSAYAIARYTPPNALQGIALLMLEALLLISCSLLGGTRLSTLTNGVLLFMLYGLAFIGAWVEQIGSLFDSDAAVNIGIISSLLMPVESVWRRAAYLMQPAISNSIPSPFSSASIPSPAMVIYAVAYGVIMLVLALRQLEKRDL
ncbi:ABC transporter permease [Chloroflexia bacterium SDU3-3]|nr:ABC transporter permease [Chloroflexia bacterium SDU3-3]